MPPSTVLPVPAEGRTITRARVLLAALVLAYLALLVPTVVDLARNIWQSDEQGHGPIIGAVSLWLMWRRRHELLDAPCRPANIVGGLLFGLAVCLYALGRSQQIIQGEVVGLILAAVALLLLFRGVQGLRVVAFPLFFLIFLIPLPGVLVQAMTIPLKTAVSYVAEALMHAAGYPIGRTGVILTVGPYQLLVADACAGLNSMFTLEALGLLYMNLLGYTSKLRNIILAVLVVPIAFIANVIRVIVLILVTYHFGDAAGQGFVHTFAGMLLFIVGLCMMLAADTVVGRMLGEQHVQRDDPAPLPGTPSLWERAGRTLTVPRVATLALLMLAAGLASKALQPTERLAERKARILLAQQIPESFGDWRLDRTLMPVVPDPGLQAMLDALYSQTLARTYVNSQGQRVMLSIAYGSDQSNEATAVHRPEFCYSAQGFRVNDAGKATLSLPAVQLPAQQLVANLGQRHEPITYWVTLDEVATLPGFGRKLQQIRYGLNGQIPDGMLVRVSSIAPAATADAAAFSLQRAFLQQLYTVIPPDVRSRYFGSAHSG